jgi:hypothetical protein
MDATSSEYSRFCIDYYIIIKCHSIDHLVLCRTWSFVIETCNQGPQLSFTLIIKIVERVQLLKNNLHLGFDSGIVWSSKRVLGEIRFFIIIHIKINGMY